MALVEQTQIGHRQLLRRKAFQQFCHRRCLAFADRIAPGRICQKAFKITRPHLIGARGRCGFCGDLGRAQQTQRLAFGLGRHDQRADTLTARTASPARAVQKRFMARRKIGMDHQIQLGQVDPARRHIGRDTDTGPAITQRLQRVGAFGLCQLARKRHNRKATVAQTGGQTVHHGACVAEHDRIGCFVIAQHVDDGVFGIALCNCQHLIFDVGVLGGLRQRFDPLVILQIGLCQTRNSGRDGGREHERTAIFGGFTKDELQILAKAQIKHFVGFIQNHGTHLRQVDRAAVDVVAQATRCGHDDMGATFQGPALVAHIHTANGRYHMGTGFGIEPAQLALDLQRQLAGRRNHQRQRQGCAIKGFGVPQKGRRHGKTKAHGLARSGLRRDQEIRVFQFGRGHGLLHRCQLLVAARLKRLFECCFQDFHFACCGARHLGHADIGNVPDCAGTRMSSSKGRQISALHCFVQYSFVPERR